jgi:SIT4 phosphatase-associated protein
LKKVSEAQEINTTYGAQIKPLGTGRLRIIEVFERLLKIKSETLYQKMSELDLINTITVPFFSLMTFRQFL